MGEDLPEFQAEPGLDLRPHLERNVKVSGVVEKVETLSMGHQKAFLKDTGGFYAFIRKSVREKFDLDLVDFQGKTVTIAGQLADYRGTTQIILFDACQIALEASEAVLPPDRPPPGSDAETSKSGGGSGGPFPLGPPNLDLVVAQDQVAIQALTVARTGREQEHGSASRFTATAFATPDGDGSWLSSNQPVGKMMTVALGEVATFIGHRHKGWPFRQSVRLGFSDKYTDKDGPSSALASAILLDSLLTGRTIPREVAVTGDLNADGRVVSVGGIRHKLMGARTAGCSTVILPAANMPDIVDIAIDGNVDLLLALNIFAVPDFDAAVAILDPAPEAPAARAREAFNTLVFGGSGGRRLVVSILGKNTTQARQFAEIEAIHPPHASAHVLARVASRELPPHYSLRGSLSRIRELQQPFFHAIQDASTDKEIRLPDRSGAGDVYADTVKALSDLQTKLHPSTVEYQASFNEFVNALRLIPALQTTRSDTRVNNVIDKVRRAERRLSAALRKIEADPEYLGQKTAD